MKIYLYSQEQYLARIQKDEDGFSVVVREKYRPFFDIMENDGQEDVRFQSFEDAKDYLEGFMKEKLGVSSVSFEDPKVGEIIWQ